MSRAIDPVPNTTLTSSAAARRADRVAGTMIGLACGDALGAPWEFGPPVRREQPLGMTGGGTFGWQPGEWTDDTSMAIPILEALADGENLDADSTLTRIVRRWSAWARTAPDVGNQTREVFSRARLLTRSPNADAVLTADQARRAATEVHRMHGRSGGNGSLMRTAPVALAYLDRPVADLVAATTRVSELTHHDPQAGQACVLWTLAIRHAISTGQVDLRIGLTELDPAAAAFWTSRIDDAEAAEPADFDRNGWVVQALQAAWSAISGASSAAAPLVLGIEAAVRGGRDSDTVAAIAGSLLGAAHGRSAIPVDWIDRLHGWPGLTGTDLADLTLRAVGQSA